MGGRGSSSMSGGAGGASVNADRHRKYLAGELGTKVTKSDEFMMNVVFPGMNYSKVRHSKSSTYAYADRVSKDGEHINVLVSSDNIKQTKFGYALQLDATHVQYVKDWQVSAQTLPHKGQVGVNVSLSKKYFNPKGTKYRNSGFSSDKK